jgi:hypothetical protein
MRYCLALCVAILLLGWAAPMSSLRAAEPEHSELQPYLDIFAAFYAHLKSGEPTSDVDLIEEAVARMLGVTTSDTVRGDALRIVGQLKQSSAQTEDEHLRAFADAYALLLGKGWDDDNADADTRDERARSLLQAAVNGLLRLYPDVDTETLDALQAAGSEREFHLERDERLGVWTFLFGRPEPSERTGQPGEMTGEVIGEPTGYFSLLQRWDVKRAAFVLLAYVLTAAVLVLGLGFLTRSLPTTGPAGILDFLAGAGAARAEVDARARAAGSFCLDRAECASILSFPLIAGSRATFLGSAVLNIGSLALLMVADILGLGNGWIVLFVFVFMSLATAMFFLLAWVLERLEPLPLTMAATVASLAFVAALLPGSYVVIDHMTRLSRPLTALYAALLIWFLWTIMRGYWALVLLPEDDRRLLRAAHKPLLSGASLADYCGVPYIAHYLTSNRWLVSFFFLLSTLMLSLYIIFLFYLVTQGIQLKDPVQQALALVFGLALLLFLLALGNFFQKVARANAWSSLDRLTVADPRPPILFLRAFRNDQLAVPVPQLGYLSRLIALGLPAHSVDTILVEEGVRFGPVVALGNPRDPLPPYGAARGYFQDKDWKRAVTDLAKASQLIVLCLEDTESVAWEIDHVIGQGYLSKVLFVVPPAYVDRGNTAVVVRNLLDKLRAAHPHVQLPETHDAADIVAVFVDDNGQVEILRSSSGSGFAYRLALRRFIYARIGDTPNSVMVSALENEIQSSIQRPASFTIAPLVAENPPQVSALQVGLLATLFILAAEIAAESAGRLVATLLASYALIRLIGGLTRLRAAAASLAGVAAGVAVLQAKEWLTADLQMESLWMMHNILVITAASCAGAYALGVRAFLSRSKAAGFVLNATFFSGSATAIGILLLHLGSLREASPGFSIGLLNTLRDACTAWFLAAALGLPLLHGSAFERLRPLRRLEGLNLLDEEQQRAWTLTLRWLLGSVIVAVLVYVAYPYILAAYLAQGESLTEDWQPRVVLGAGSVADITATTCLCVGALWGLKPRSLLWVLSSIGLFLSAGLAQPVLPWSAQQFVFPVAGLLSLLLGLLAARKDWPTAWLLPRAVYVLGITTVAWIALRTTSEVILAMQQTPLR